MAKKSNHVVPSKKNGGWAVRKADATRASGSFATKAEAVRYGQELSRREKSELYIHKKDGTIQDRRSYGTDPFLPETEGNYVKS